MSTVTLSHDAHRASAEPSRLGHLALLLARRVVRRVRIRSDRRTLQGMPDHMLKDIGISRTDIDRAVERGRWTKL